MSIRVAIPPTKKRYEPSQGYHVAKSRFTRGAGVFGCNVNSELQKQLAGTYRRTEASCGRLINQIVQHLFPLAKPKKKKRWFRSFGKKVA